MPHFVLIGRDRPDGLELRLKNREEHLKGLSALQAAGRLVAAGPIRDGEDKPRGSVVIFAAENLEAARALMSKDPYVRENVFASWTVEPYLVVYPR